jgi:hypothetical protein
MGVSYSCSVYGFKQVICDCENTKFRVSEDKLPSSDAGNVVTKNRKVHTEELAVL